MSKPIYLGIARERLNLLHCPNCGGPAEGATSISLVDERPRPKPGDYSICLYCSTLLIFEASVISMACPLRLRVATPAEIAAFSKANPQFAEAFKIIGTMGRKPQ